MNNKNGVKNFVYGFVAQSVTIGSVIFGMKCDRLRKNIPYGIIFLLCGAFLVWRARYGYCFNDEPFIISVAHRLISGDMLIFDEWHPTQLFSMLILPFVKAYLFFNNNSTVGLLLYMRYWFCFLWLLTGVCIFFTLREYTKHAIVILFYFILFAPFDYMTCSYNSFGIMGMIVLSCLVLYAFKSAKTVSGAFFIGISSSLLLCCVILCSPYFAVVYGVAVIFFASALFAKKIHKYWWGVLAINVICSLTVGSVCFYFFAMRGHSLQALFSVIPHIFDDPEHSGSVYSKLYSALGAMARLVEVSFIIDYTLAVVYLVKKSPKLRGIICVFGVLSFAFGRILVTRLAIQDCYFNYEMFDFSLLGFLAFLLLENKPWSVLSVWVLGLTYAGCAFLASNTGLLALSAAMVPCGVIGAVFILLLVQEQLEKMQPSTRDVCFKRVCSVSLVVIVFVSQLSSQVLVRVQRQYWDSNLSQLTEKIDCGAAKGLVTTPERCSQYAEEYNALKSMLGGATDAAERSFLNCNYSVPQAKTRLK